MLLSKKNFLLVAILLVGSLSHSPSGYGQESELEMPSFDYEQVGAEGAIQALQAMEDQAEMAAELSELYQNTLDPKFMQELRRLVLESANPEVRLEALNGVRAGAAAQQEAEGLGTSEAVMARSLPSDVDAVSVQCEGTCSDVTLGEICDSSDSPTPIAVDCQSIDDDPENTRCNLTGTSFCSVNGFNRGEPLSNYCVNINGWDAHVYCAR